MIMVQDAVEMMFEFYMIFVVEPLGFAGGLKI